MQSTELTAIAQAVERIREQIPAANLNVRNAMLEQLTKLRDMSGAILDAWLQVDEAIEETVRELENCELSVESSKEVVSSEPHIMSDVQNVEARDGGLDMQPVQLAEAWFDLSLKSECLLRKGLAYFDLEMFSEAAKTLTDAVDEQDLPGARIYLALSFLAAGQFSEAAHHLEAARYMADDDLTMQAVLEAEVQMYAMHEDWSATVRTLYELLAYHPDLGDTWFNIGISHLHLDEFAAAERCFAQSTQYKPDEATILWRALSFALIDRRDRSIELLHNLTVASGGFHELRSTVYLAVGMVEYALDHAAQIADKRRASTLTALCFILSGRHQAAILRLKRQLTLHPLDDKAVTLFGICSYLTGNLVRARKSFAANENKTQASPFIELLRARIDMAVDDMDVAKDRLRSLAEQARLPVRRLAVLYLGMIHLRSGKDDAATESFARAQELGLRREVIELAISSAQSMIVQG